MKYDVAYVHLWRLLRHTVLRTPLKREHSANSTSERPPFVRFHTAATDMRFDSWRCSAARSQTESAAPGGAGSKAQPGDILERSNSTDSAESSSSAVQIDTNAESGERRTLQVTFTCNQCGACRPSLRADCFYRLGTS